jgi:DNA-binding MarR family transcriptional regulator
VKPLQNLHTDLITLPDPLRRHPLFLMITLLKLARQKGLSQQHQLIMPGSELRFVDIAVLTCLNEGGPMSQKAVSRLLKADPSDLVDIIDKLETAGLVKRARDLEDRRRHSLELTETALQLLPQIQQQSTAFMRQFFSPLTAPEQKELRRLLGKLIQFHTQ